MEAYAAAKARVFGTQALMVLNREDPLVMQMLPEPVRLKGGKYEQRDHVTFGGDLPQRPATSASKSSTAWPGWCARTRPTRPRSAEGRGAGAAPPALMPADALRIRGRHNAVNALAALALATAAGCPLAPMLYGLREYRGEPHRVEPVGIVHDIEYFDDSKGTNVGATVAALQGLGAERKLVVILGGDGKGQDFAPLAAPVARYVRAAVLIGRDAPASAPCWSARRAAARRRNAAAGRALATSARQPATRADVAGLRQLRHVPQLPHAPRCSARRAGVADEPACAEGAHELRPTLSGLHGCPAGRGARLRAARRSRAGLRPGAAVGDGGAAGLRPGDGVFGSIAMPDNPKFARYAPPTS
jgi:UDP-N-acetylmuramoylalanine-D-glutamate ligase